MKKYISLILILCACLLVSCGENARTDEDISKDAEFKNWFTRSEDMIYDDNSDGKYDFSVYPAETVKAGAASARIVFEDKNGNSFAHGSNTYMMEKKLSDGTWDVLRFHDEFGFYDDCCEIFATDDGTPSKSSMGIYAKNHSLNEFSAGEYRVTLLIITDGGELVISGEFVIEP
ncbi:MAG: hypothetical protein IIW63_02990 [Clostridia bacterium]|nr:hypothetical protein [Clostridia bacterium]